MTPEQFDICLEFHLGLIRSRPRDDTVNMARHGTTNGAAGNLINALNMRMSNLEWYIGATDNVKIQLYNLNNTRNPSVGAFRAAFGVINDGAKISKAAIANKVNYQSVKVLIPRLKRWEKYAAKLAKTL